MLREGGRSSPRPIGFAALVVAQHWAVQLEQQQQQLVRAYVGPKAGQAGQAGQAQARQGQGKATPAPARGSRREMQSKSRSVSFPLRPMISLLHALPNNKPHMCSSACRMCTVGTLCATVRPNQHLFLQTLRCPTRARVLPGGRVGAGCRRIDFVRWHCRVFCSPVCLWWSFGFGKSEWRGGPRPAAPHNVWSRVGWSCPRG